MSTFVICISRMQNNYDHIAPYYDVLSKIVFGNAIINAQAWAAQQIPENSKIFIVGGGTGKVLEALSNHHPANLTITYVDISQRMLAQAKTRNFKKNKVLFIQKAAEDFFTEEQFDVLFTGFFLDNFRQEKMNAVFSHLHKLLQQNGLWLFTDFTNRNSKIWKKVLLKSMYTFFKLTCNIEPADLPEMEDCFKENNYGVINEKSFYKGFIQSVVYRKK